SSTPRERSRGGTAVPWKEGFVPTPHHGQFIDAAGFAEMSDDGARIQQDMVARCKELGMRVVGPNCMGVFSTGSRMNLTDVEHLELGRIGFVSQSGNIALTRSCRPIGCAKRTPVAPSLASWTIRSPPR
ncbi:hypothetical protein ACFU9K_44375, partial [Streptomyces sp. NPDC057582]